MKFTNPQPVSSDIEKNITVGNESRGRRVEDSMSVMPKLLRYSSDAEPGYARRVQGSGFSFFDDKGSRVTKETVLSRINGLGLPPAYTDVWICKDEFGHLQATGRDEKGRKQYRYHSDWRIFRDQQKFEGLPDFAEALPRIRAKVARDLKRDTPDRIFVSAALVRLIDKGALRIGNRGYEGDSFGASTLRTRHFKITDNGFQLDYRAKGGKRVRKSIRDSSLAKTLEEIDDLPGRHLFQYVGDGGEICRLDSADVNAYLPDAFTAKTFRTWHGTVAAFKAAQDENPTIKSLSEAAAARLHNTPAICRSSYIHPNVIALAEVSEAERQMRLQSLSPPATRGLVAAERSCLALISR